PGSPPALPSFPTRRSSDLSPRFSTIPRGGPPVAEFLFWTCLLLPAYAWLGYPLVLRVLGTFISRPVRSGNSALSVSIIIAAHNEAAHIQSKIRSLLGQGYPASALEILVASDGSGDDTVALAEAVGDARVRVLDRPRMGKTRALKAAVAEAR